MNVGELTDLLNKMDSDDEVVLVMDDADYDIDSISHDGMTKVLIIGGGAQ